MLARVLKIAWYSFLAVIVLLALALLLLQTPKIQTALTSKAADWLSENVIDADISFERIHIQPFNTLIIKGLSVVDKTPYQLDSSKVEEKICAKLRQIGCEPIDTLFRAEYVIANFSLRGLLSSSISINKAEIKNAQMNLVLEDMRNKMNTNLTRMFRLPKKDIKPKKENKEIFVVKDIEIDNIRYTMKSYNCKTPAQKLEGGIDWNDLDVRNIMIKGRNLRMRGAVMSGELDHLSFEEKSGYRVYEISGHTRVGAGRAVIEEFRLRDPWSRIYLPHFSMHYASDRDFADYVNAIKMVANIEPSRVDFRTLGYFAPGLQGKTLVLDVDGAAIGYVNKFDITALNFSTPDNLVEGHIHGSLSGMVDRQTGNGATAGEDFVVGSRIKTEAVVEKLHFTGQGLENVIRAWSPASKINVSNYGKGVIFDVQAKAEGSLADLDISVTLNSDVGSANTEIEVLNLIDKARSTEISGKLNTKDLNLNSIISNIPVKETALEADLDIKLSPEKNKNPIALNSLKINRLNFNNYDYRGIAATGVLAGRSFDGKLICNDPNLNFLFQGIFSFSNKTNNSLYRFYANVGHADLEALNFDKRGKSRVRLQAKADFTKTGNGNVLGKIDVANIVLENKHETYNIGDINLSSFTGNNSYTIRLLSDFAEGTYTGSAPIMSFIRDLGGTSIKKELPSLFKSPETQWNGDNYKLSFKTLKSFDLLSFIAPGMYIAADSDLKIELDRNAVLSASFKSQRIAYREQYMKDVSLKVNNEEESLSGTLESGSASVVGLSLKNNIFKFFANDDRLTVGFNYDNQDSAGNRGEVLAVGSFDKDEDAHTNYDIKLLPSSIFLNGKEWQIFPSDAKIRNKMVELENFELRCGKQTIKAYGAMSDRPDTLNLNLNKFDISILNPIVGKQLGIKGSLSGSARLTSPSRNRGFLVDLVCDSTEVGGEALGNLRFISRWNPDFSRFDLGAMNELDGHSSIALNGKYTPAAKRLETNIILDAFSLKYAKPFVQSIFSELGGSISGKLSAEGNLNGLQFRSEGTQLEDAYLKVAYTNVGYKASGAFSLDEKGVYFDNVSITDRFDNKGRLSGKISHNRFKNIFFDTNIDFNRIEAVDIAEADSDVFYGHLFAGGNVSISGPVNALTLAADVATSREGNLHIPLNSSMNAGSTNLLKFTEAKLETEIDPYEVLIQKLKTQETRSDDFALKLKVSTDPQVEVFVELDQNNGNVLNGRGNGDIELSVNKNLFDIKGDYTLQSGSFHFVALGIATRDFVINEGSNIRFNGDIMESTLNINASYRTKTSLATLIADTTSVNNRRIVDCGIRITDKLSNPRLAFSIDVPDIDPIIKSRVESALSTEDKVQKQFLALLISNNFLPDEQSSVTNNSPMLYSSLSDIMSNQLNNILQKLNIPLDLGLNYEQDSRGTDIFDVAVSTQLFNNRIVVNGNIGNRQYGGNSNDIIGDLNIEIKLNRPGTFRLNLFSHSADQYTNYLDDSQRNGVGVTYQQEFNNFGRFVKRIFQSRKKKEEIELQEAEAAMKEEKIIFEINRKDE